MATKAQKTFAVGKAKEYYQIEDSFEAVGTLFVDWNMHYTAAGPKGVWLCGNVLNNQPIIIGLIDWSNITRMIVDKEAECVYIEVRNSEEVIRNASFDFQKLHKKAFLHTMSDTGLVAICLPIDLFSGKILYYLQEHVKTEFKAEPRTRSEKKRDVIVSIILVILLLVGILSWLF